jgi:hypothetical protein
MEKSNCGLVWTHICDETEILPSQLPRLWPANELVPVVSERLDLGAVAVRILPYAVKVQFGFQITMCVARWHVGWILGRLRPSACSNLGWHCRMVHRLVRRSPSGSRFSGGDKSVGFAGRGFRCLAVKYRGSGLVFFATKLVIRRALVVIAIVGRATFHITRYVFRAVFESCSQSGVRPLDGLLRKDTETCFFTAQRGVRFGFGS